MFILYCGINVVLDFTQFHIEKNKFPFFKDIVLIPFIISALTIYISPNRYMLL